MLSNPSISIKTEIFEGPLDLLIDLVEKRKLLINDISLAAVTDEYIERVAMMQEASLPNTSQFIELAATLVLIKSKSLLPVLDLSKEEESAIEELEERLRLYQIFKTAAKDIQTNFGKCNLHYRRPQKREILFTPPADITVKFLSKTILLLTSALEVPTAKPKVQVKATVSLEEMMNKLESNLKTRARVTLSELIRGYDEPKIAIVGFLAVLEAVRNGGHSVSQIEPFADISLESNEIRIPQY
tara:strand:- start:2682 stop:3410 length:729 start_codon:yes stop_codon:yes gene_type:complete